MRHKLTRAILVASLLLAAAQAAGGAGQEPVAVSPGSPTGVVIADTCPTFSWGQVDGAKSYEVVLYRLRGDGERTEQVLRRRFIGSVSSWTPSVDLCLERGGRYAWSVRAVSGRTAVGWSSPALFEVASEPTTAELQELIQRYLASKGIPAAGGTAGEPGSTRGSDAGPEAGEEPTEPLGVGGSDFSIDATGRVQAESLTARGLRLVPTDSPPDCLPDVEGGLYWDASLQEYCFCDGTPGWQPLFSDPCSSAPCVGLLCMADCGSPGGYACVDACIEATCEQPNPDCDPATGQCSCDLAVCTPSECCFGDVCVEPCLINPCVGLQCRVDCASPGGRRCEDACIGVVCRDPVRNPDCDPSTGSCGCGDSFEVCSSGQGCCTGGCTSLACDPSGTDCPPGWSCDPCSGCFDPGG